MFGLFGGKKERKRSKEEESYIEQKDNEAMWGLFTSSREQSDQDAKRGGR